MYVYFYIYIYIIAKKIKSQKPAVNLLSFANLANLTKWRHIGVYENEVHLQNDILNKQNGDKPPTLGIPYLQTKPHLHHGDTVSALRKMSRNIARALVPEQGPEAAAIVNLNSEETSALEDHRVPSPRAPRGQTTWRT
jgi:hypothetical protein